ncbi:MAG: hypothetical protein Q9227_008045 [Pyrenula ochraceoflavens]
MPEFGFHTTGAEVVEAFKDQVEGKTVLITGAGVTGLGAGSAVALARANPAHLLLHARTLNRVEPVLEEIRSINPSLKTTFIFFDLADPSSVRAAAAEISSKIEKLHILMNNAGVMAIQEYTKNKDGNEMTLATNHLGHFLLTALLMPKILAAGKGARIINVSSLGHKICPFRFDDYNFSDGKKYNPWAAYGQTKTANILFSHGLATRLGKRGIQSFSLHPGAIWTTTLIHGLDQSHFSQILPASQQYSTATLNLDHDDPKTLEQGVATQLVAALDPGLEGQNGAYLEDCKVVEEADYARAEENVEKLWELSERVVGEKIQY